MEFLSIILKKFGSVFIPMPGLAIIPAGILFLIFLKSKRWVVLFGSCCWLIYLAYEYAMAMRILCTGECNIRIDLLLIYPFLLIVTIATLISSIREFVPNKTNHLG